MSEDMSSMMIPRITSPDIKTALQLVLKQMDNAISRRAPSIKTKAPMLVVVSKTKPVESILEVYSTGQRHFGENYVQELHQKANDEKILEHCKDIKWHFIGHLQRNKIPKLMQVPNLYMVQTIDSQKLAESLNTAWERKSEKDPLKVLVQVNTSYEESKNGISSSAAIDMFKYITDSCKSLSVDGLMTIGKLYGPDEAQEYNEHNHNPDFDEMMSCHATLCEKLDRRPDTVDISMGMSNDFVHAIELGSTMARVGSSIFGSRPLKEEIGSQTTNSPVSSSNPTN